MPGPSAVSEALGDALVLHAAPLQAALSLVGAPHWARTMQEPQYPANAYTMCPRLRLHLVQANEQPEGGSIAAGMVHGATYLFSWFYYRRQVPGQAHQKLLVADLEVIRNPYLTTAFQPNINVTGFSLESCIPSPTNILTELRHEFDDPALRVSVGQIDLTIKGQVTIC